MNPIGNYRGETAKSLRVCKTVSALVWKSRLSQSVTLGLDKYLSSLAKVIQNSAYRIQTKYMKNTLSKARCFSFVGIFNFHKITSCLTTNNSLLRIFSAQSVDFRKGDTISNFVFNFQKNFFINYFLKNKNKKLSTLFM